MSSDISKDEKTEAATPRRREESREMGQVPFSTDLTAAIVIAVAAIAMIIQGHALVATSGLLTTQHLESLSNYAREELSPSKCVGIAKQILEDLAYPVFSVLLPMMICGILIAYWQVGFRITPKAVAPDAAKVNPFKGLQRLFSFRSVFRLGTSSAKLMLIASAMAISLALSVPRLAGLGGSELRPALAALGNVVLRSCLAGIVAILVMAIIDFIFQRNRHESDLRMSKEEVKREHRESEGDPHVKQRIRRVQRDLAVRRMMSDVESATVVITNPTHYAVALSYSYAAKESTSRAPRVVAKGTDLVAQRIKEIARGAGVPCYENAPLARALHAKTEIGQEIPEELFQAVANVLAYVYRLQKQGVAV